MCSADDDDEFRSWSVQPSNKEQKKKQIGGRHFLLGIPNGAETKVPDSFWTFVELRWAIVPTPESRDTRPTHSRRRQATKVIKSAIKKKVMAKSSSLPLIRSRRSHLYAPWTAQSGRLLSPVAPFASCVSVCTSRLHNLIRYDRFVIMTMHT